MFRSNTTHPKKVAGRFFTNLLCLAGIYIHEQPELSLPVKLAAGLVSNKISICVFERTRITLKRNLNKHRHVIMINICNFVTGLEDAFERHHF